MREKFRFVGRRRYPHDAEHDLLVWESDATQWLWDADAFHRQLTHTQTAGGASTRDQAISQAPPADVPAPPLPTTKETP